MPSQSRPGIARATSPSGPKPRLRGWLHAVTAPLLLLAGLALIVVTHSLAGRVSEAIYLLTGLMLFGNSAVYHRGHWSGRGGAVGGRGEPPTPGPARAPARPPPVRQWRKQEVGTV